MRTSVNNGLIHRFCPRIHLWESSLSVAPRCKSQSLTTLTVSLFDKSARPPGDFNIKCKNCTIQGNIDLVAGSLTVGGLNHASPNSTQGIVNITESVVDYVEHGYVHFTSNNFGAYIELESTVGGSDSLANYTAPLPTIPLTPFQVSGTSFNRLLLVANSIQRSQASRPWDLSLCLMFS